MRRNAHEMGAVFGGRMPSPHACVPGGFTSTVDRGADQRVSRVARLAAHFIRATYVPDAEAIGAVYSDYYSIGGGYKDLLAFGVFEQVNAGHELAAQARDRQRRDRQDGRARRERDHRAGAQLLVRGHATNLKPASGRTDPVYPKGRPTRGSRPRATRASRTRSGRWHACG